MTRVPILMYHSITDRPTAATRALAVPSGAFSDHLTYLKENGFSPMTFGGLVTTLGGDAALPERPIVLTFDDGYADFHSGALPQLERHGVSATLFLTTGWLADAGADAAGSPLDDTLSWSQVTEAVSTGIEVAGHSHSHPQLDQLPDAALREELRRNKSLIEDRLGVTVTTMAYPYGYSSARVRRQARREGYVAACAVNNAVATRRHDVLAVPRLTIGPGTTMTRFGHAVNNRGIPLIYLKERVLTKGYAMVRRTRYGLRKALRHV